MTECNEQDQIPLEIEEPEPAADACCAASEEEPAPAPASAEFPPDVSRDAGPEPPREHGKDSIFKRLKPLFLIAAYLVFVPGVLTLLSGGWDLATHMRHFMGGFFVVFSFFKLLDLPGFVVAYRRYDFIAAAFKPWAWAYPFIELALGILYLADVFPFGLNAIVLVLMLVGIAGIFRALVSGEKIRCACLGTVLDLPMTSVTLIENLIMAFMAGYMIYRTFTGE